jgi:hypothetical protein
MDVRIPDTVMDRRSSQASGRSIRRKRPPTFATGELSTEPLVTLTRAARLLWLPRPLHPSTLYRWAMGGRRGVRLETVRVGDTLCTSETALRRFFERISSGDPAQDDPTPSQQRRAHERAQRELAAAGIGKHQVNRVQASERP